MIIAEVISNIRILLGEAEKEPEEYKLSDAQLKLLIEMAESKIVIYCNIRRLPDELIISALIPIVLYTSGEFSGDNNELLVKTVSEGNGSTTFTKAVSDGSVNKILEFKIQEYKEILNAFRRAIW